MPASPLHLATGSGACAVPGLRHILRPVARLLIAAQLALVLQPLSALAQPRGQTPVNPVAQAQLKRYQALSHQISQAQADKLRQAMSPADLLPDHLERVQRLAQALQAEAGNTSLKSSAVQGTSSQLQWSELQGTLEAIRGANGNLLAELAATGQQLESKGAASVILERQAQAERQAQERIQQFERIASALLPQATSDASGMPTTKSLGLAELQAATPALAELERFAQQNTRGEGHTPLDAKKLPWGAAKGTPRAPAETAEDWGKKMPTQAVSAVKAKAKTATAQAKASPKALTTIAGLQFTDPPAAAEAPTSADLAETAEVQLTAAIRAKASELDHNPVAIQNWVRNTIDWQPTWGALQSADSVLASKKGNAHDIASLTIALLRASNIPARYQWGTIELPAEAVMNWVGGMSKPEAALNLMGQGGIAARGVASAGRIQSIRMEHVWVNAYVNFAPSRGALAGGADMTPAQHVNPNAALNAWVPVDGAYKQYSYAVGMDLKNQVPLDADALLNAAKQGATVNEGEGWVQNLNQQAVQSQMTAYQNRLKSYIDGQKPNATVGDVIGKKIIPERMPLMLAGTTSYPVIAQGAEAASIPASQQHRFVFKLYASQQDRTWDDPRLSFSELTSRLGGKRISLSYAPATEADADLIASYLPQPHADGSPIQPSELPTSLPGYLIRLKPQISVDGQVVAQSSTPFTMGTDLYSLGGFTRFGNFSQDLMPSDSHVAGQATAIGISVGGITQQQLEQLKSRLEDAKAKLQNAQGGNQAALQSLTGEQIAGDLLTAPMWSWFAANESHARLSQGQAGIVEVTGNSFGLFHAIANPIYSWGVVRKVTFPGANIDVGYQRLLSTAKDNGSKTWVAYNRLRGQYASALEHAIPEKFFNDPAKCNSYDNPNPIAALPACPQGISAMKALGLASAQGQKIYTITQEVYQHNPNIVSTNLSAHSDLTRSRIQNALAQELEVTIHEQPITVGKWTGAGYTLIDPSTGAGAYEIEGIKQGGDFLTGDQSLVINITAIFVGLVGVVGALIAALLSLFTWIDTYFDMLQYVGCPGFDLAFAATNYFNVISILVGLAAIPIGLIFGALAGAIMFLIGISLFLSGFQWEQSLQCSSRIRVRGKR